MAVRQYEELVSYAQNHEDMILHTLLHATQKGFYVDIGANHETLHSVTKFFYERGWRGINIDPNKALMKEFKGRTRDINLTIGVSDKKGSMQFREYPHHDGLSTLAPEIKKQHEGEDLPYVDYNVPVTRLKDILKKHRVTRIDFLKVDVEGHELEALKGSDWQKYRPAVVLFEGTYLEACRSFLEEQGYHEVFFDGLNVYMVDNARTDLDMSQYPAVLLSYGYKTHAHKLADVAHGTLEHEVTSLRIELDRLMHEAKQILPVRKSAHMLVRSLKRSLRARSRLMLGRIVGDKRRQTGSQDEPEII